MVARDEEAKSSRRRCANLAGLLVSGPASGYIAAHTQFQVGLWMPHSI